MVYSYTTDEKNENPRFPHVSSGAERVYGISPEAIMDDAMRLISIIHPDDIGSFVASVNESWETLAAWDWKGRFKMRTEEFKWIRCSSMPQRRPNGHTIWHGAVFDIQADVDLEESRAELDSLVRSANAPIFQVDPRGVVATCNPTFLSLLDFEVGAVLGHALTGLVPEESRDRLAGVLAAALRGEEAKGYELTLTGRGGESVVVMLNASPRRDAWGDVLGVVCVGQDVTQVRLEAARAKAMKREKDTVADKYARALDFLTDVVFEVSASSWESEDWRVGEHSSSYNELFPTIDAPLLDFVKEPDKMLRLLQGARDSALNQCEMSVFQEGSSRMLTVDFQAVNISDPTGRPNVLVVCHDLTDFKFRTEVEKDREVAAKLQHEDKNTHKAQEVSAHHALEQLGIIEAQLNTQRDAAERFESPELKQVWMDLARMHVHSFAAIKQAKATLRTLECRSQRAQQESHTRIMMYQLVADEYVAALTPIDVVARLEEELCGASDVRLRAFHVPEVQCDWTLLWYGLENALSNARKYGLRREPIEFALEYREPMLTIVVTNVAEPKRQAQLIATHGCDATKLLHRRVEGGGTHSTNLGGHALRDVARLMRGSVSLHLLPEATRLQLQVCTPRQEDVQVGEALLVYFIDDEPTMRMIYSAWVRQPSPLHPDSKVFPPPGLSPSETDDAMRQFAHGVISAQPQPTVVVVDQNLRSQVSRRENVTTGTEIASSLRKQGYRGTIVIRSANVSTRSLQEYLAAGADAAMTKDEPRDRLLNIVRERNSLAPAPRSADDDDELSQTPLLVSVEDGPMIGTAADRDAIMGEFRSGARATLDDLRALLDAADVGALPDELHYLLGQCRAVGARRLQLAISGCKERFGYPELERLEALLRQTLEESEARSGGAPTVGSAGAAGSVGGSGTGGGRGEELVSAVPVADPPLVDAVVARRMSTLLPVGFEACRKDMAELRLAVKHQEPIHLLLHNLCGQCESMGAAKLARRCAQLKRRGESGMRRTDSLMADVDALDLLLLQTESAIQALAISSASPPQAVSSSMQSPLFVACIDDAYLTRELMRLALFPAIGADTSRSVALGETREEQLSFVDVALGQLDQSLRPLPPPHHPADIVVLDQNILLDGELHCCGTVIAEQLRARGFKGVVCIMTGDAEDANRLGTVATVDICVSKSVSMMALADQLKQMAANIQQLPPTTESSSSTVPDRPLPILDISHFMGMPHEALQKLFLLAYHPTEKGSIALVLRWLQATFHEGRDDFERAAHTLLGTARTAGANVLARHVRDFKAAPSAAALEAMWPLLDEAREQMKIEGYIPADAFSDAVVAS